MKSLAQVEPHTAITSLPITISNPGSYYLTGNLTATADGTAITIAADNVTIDLNRFILAGGGTGTRLGIDVPAAQKGLCVRNGTVTGWTSFGILGFNMTGGVFEDLRLIGNVGSYALSAGNGALVRRCVVTGNSGSHSVLFLQKNSSAIDCTVSFNTGGGIYTDSGCNIVNTNASGNTQHGIFPSGNSTVAQCTASNNG